MCGCRRALTPAPAVAPTRGLVDPGPAARFGLGPETVGGLAFKTRLYADTAAQRQFLRSATGFRRWCWNRALAVWNAMHEAAMLHDYFRQVRESHPNRNEELFRSKLSGATELAGQMETCLDNNQKEQATQHFTALKQSCVQCHKACRD